MSKILKTPPKALKKCSGCRRKPCVPKSKYCPDCSRLYHRMRNKGFPPKTVKAIWAYVLKYGYICYYTGMKLDLDNPQSPRYLVFDHWIPGDPSKVVICAAVINEMKSDMTQDEFEDTVCQIADHFRKGTPVVLKPFAHWYRLIEE